MELCQLLCVMGTGGGDGDVATGGWAGPPCGPRGQGLPPCGTGPLCGTRPHMGTGLHVELGLGAGLQCRPWGHGLGLREGVGLLCGTGPWGQASVWALGTWPGP